MTLQNKTMKMMPPQSQPYEKAKLYGIQALSDAELLAVIIRNGSTGLTALETAETILKELGSLSGLCSSHLKLTDKIPGIGPVKQLQLMAIGELAIRLWRSEHSFGLEFTNAAFVYEYFREEMRHNKQERVYALFLDAGCHLLHQKEMSKGTLYNSPISPREIFREALHHDASGIILVHNHPGGDPTPSEDDIYATRIINGLGEQMLLPLMDHVIIGDNTYISMKEQGYLS